MINDGREVAGLLLQCLLWVASTFQLSILQLLFTAEVWGGPAAHTQSTLILKSSNPWDVCNIGELVLIGECVSLKHDVVVACSCTLWSLVFSHPISSQIYKMRDFRCSFALSIGWGQSVLACSVIFRGSCAVVLWCLLIKCDRTIQQVSDKLYWAYTEVTGIKVGQGFLSHFQLPVSHSLCCSLLSVALQASVLQLLSQHHTAPDHHW